MSKGISALAAFLAGVQDQAKNCSTSAATNEKRQALGGIAQDALQILKVRLTVLERILNSETQPSASPFLLT